MVFINLIPRPSTKGKPNYGSNMLLNMVPTLVGKKSKDSIESWFNREARIIGGGSGLAGEYDVDPKLAQVIGKKRIRVYSGVALEKGEVDRVALIRLLGTLQQNREYEKSPRPTAICIPPDQRKYYPEDLVEQYFGGEEDLTFIYAEEVGVFKAKKPTASSSTAPVPQGFRIAASVYGRISPFVGSAPELVALFLPVDDLEGGLLRPEFESTAELGQMEWEEGDIENGAAYFINQWPKWNQVVEIEGVKYPGLKFNKPYVYEAWPGGTATVSGPYPRVEGGVLPAIKGPNQLPYMQISGGVGKTSKTLLVFPLLSAQAASRLSRETIGSYQAYLEAALIIAKQISNLLSRPLTFIEDNLRLLRPEFLRPFKTIAQSGKVRGKKGRNHNESVVFPWLAKSGKKMMSPQTGLPIIREARGVTYYGDVAGTKDQIGSFKIEKDPTVGRGLWADYKDLKQKRKSGRVKAPIYILQIVDDCLLPGSHLRDEYHQRLRGEGVIAPPNRSDLRYIAGAKGLTQVGTAEAWGPDGSDPDLPPINETYENMLLWWKRLSQMRENLLNKAISRAQQGLALPAEMQTIVRFYKAFQQGKTANRWESNTPRMTLGSWSTVQLGREKNTYLLTVVAKSCKIQHLVKGTQQVLLDMNAFQSAMSSFMESHVEPVILVDVPSTGLKPGDWGSVKAILKNTASGMGASVHAYRVPGVETKPEKLEKYVLAQQKKRTVEAPLLSARGQELRAAERSPVNQWIVVIGKNKKKRFVNILRKQDANIAPESGLQFTDPEWWKTLTQAGAINPAMYEGRWKIMDVMSPPRPGQVMRFLSPTTMRNFILNTINDPVQMGPKGFATFNEWKMYLGRQEEMEKLAREFLRPSQQISPEWKKRGEQGQKTIRTWEMWARRALGYDELKKIVKERKPLDDPYEEQQMYGDVWSPYHPQADEHGYVKQSKERTFWEWRTTAQPLRPITEGIPILIGGIQLSNEPPLPLIESKYKRATDELGVMMKMMESAPLPLALEFSQEYSAAVDRLRDQFRIVEKQINAGMIGKDTRKRLQAERDKVQLLLARRKLSSIDENISIFTNKINRMETLAAQSRTRGLPIYDKDTAEAWLAGEVKDRAAPDGAMPVPYVFAIFENGAAAQLNFNMDKADQLWKQPGWRYQDLKTWRIDDFWLTISSLLGPRNDEVEPQKMRSVSVDRSKSRRDQRGAAITQVADSLEARGGQKNLIRAQQVRSLRQSAKDAGRDKGEHASQQKIGTQILRSMGAPMRYEGKGWMKGGAQTLLYTQLYKISGEGELADLREEIKKAVGAEKGALEKKLAQRVAYWRKNAGARRIQGPDGRPQWEVKVYTPQYTRVEGKLVQTGKSKSSWMTLKQFYKEQRERATSTARGAYTDSKQSAMRNLLECFIPKEGFQYSYITDDMNKYRAPIASARLLYLEDKNKSQEEKMKDQQEEMIQRFRKMEEAVEQNLASPDDLDALESQIVDAGKRLAAAQRQTGFLRMMRRTNYPAEPRAIFYLPEFQNITIAGRPDVEQRLSRMKALIEAYLVMDCITPDEELEIIKSQTKRKVSKKERAAGWKGCVQLFRLSDARSSGEMEEVDTAQVKAERAEIDARMEQVEAAIAEKRAELDELMGGLDTEVANLRKRMGQFQSLERQIVQARHRKKEADPDASTESEDKRLVRVDTQLKEVKGQIREAEKRSKYRLPPEAAQLKEEVKSLEGQVQYLRAERARAGSGGVYRKEAWVARTAKGWDKVLKTKAAPTWTQMMIAPYGESKKSNINRFARLIAWGQGKGKAQKDGWSSIPKEDLRQVKKEIQRNAGSPESFRRYLRRLIEMEANKLKKR